MELLNKINLPLEVEVQEVNKSKGVFLIIGGSGKIDKNGNTKQFKMNIYKDISDVLYSMDYTVLRYSKRGTGLSGGKYNETGLNDLLEDLDTLVTYIKKVYPEQKIYLLGHSEGAMLATLYTKNHIVDGIILISGAGIGLKDALILQNSYLSNEIKTLRGFKGKLLRLLLNEQKIHKQQLKMFDRVSNTEKDVIRIQLVPIPAKWMREHFTIKTKNYLKLLEELSIPTLVLQGNKDAHTSLDFVKSIEILNNQNITINILDNVDHILRDFDGKLTILNIKKQYKKDSKLPVSNKIKLHLAKWVDQL